MQMYMEMLAVIEVRPEEGGGGAVCVTLLLNCVTVLLKVRCVPAWAGVSLTSVLGEILVLRSGTCISQCQ